MNQNKSLIDNCLIILKSEANYYAFDENTINYL